MTSFFTNKTSKVDRVLIVHNWTFMSLRQKIVINIIKSFFAKLWVLLDMLKTRAWKGFRSISHSNARSSHRKWLIPCLIPDPISSLSSPINNVLIRLMRLVINSWILQTWTGWLKRELHLPTVTSPRLLVHQRGPAFLRDITPIPQEYWKMLIAGVKVGSNSLTNPDITVQTSEKCTHGPLKHHWGFMSVTL